MKALTLSNIIAQDLMHSMEDPSAEKWVNPEMESLFYEECLNPRLQPLKQAWSSYAAAETTTFLEFGTSSDIYSPSDVGFVASTHPIASQASSLDQHHTKLRDHSLAERKRREKLSHLFIALSALLPGLKKVYMSIYTYSLVFIYICIDQMMDCNINNVTLKMDKASILEDAVSYMNELQQKVKGLEKKADKKTMKSAMRFTIKKDDDDDDDDGGGKKSEMEARFGDNDELLISIQCERRKGLLEKIVGEIEKMKLSIVNTSVLAYGSSSLTITLIAEVYNYIFSCFTN